MINGPAFSFWSALLALNPLISYGLIPAPAGAVSSDPVKVRPYALLGMLGIFVFSLAAWQGHYFFGRHQGLAWAELPFQLLALIIMYRIMGWAVRPWSVLRESLPLFQLNFLSLSSGLLLLEHNPHGWREALLASGGMSVSFGLSLMLIAFLRERMESLRFSKPLSGWPLFLLLSSVIWISARGLTLLLP